MNPVTDHRALSELPRDGGLPVVDFAKYPAKARGSATVDGLTGCDARSGLSPTLPAFDR
jgi:hypothetical protein